MSRSRSALCATGVAAASVLLCAPSASACTNLLVSQGASHDASTILAYNADSGSLYGSLGHYPATDDNQPNATREVWDWDDSVFLGVIPEARRTFNVIGNANERGLVIGETTFGGLPELDCHGTGGVMDYGSLIWIALQRAETCAEAIDVIDALVQTHGYASDGESFSCVDGAEAWLMELVGKGARERGAVWVATRVPDGAVLAHANQARTTTFDMNDPVNVRYSPDVVSFARYRSVPRRRARRRFRLQRGVRSHHVRRRAARRRARVGHLPPFGGRGGYGTVPRVRARIRSHESPAAVRVSLDASGRRVRDGDHAHETRGHVVRHARHTPRGRGRRDRATPRIVSAR